MLLASYTQSVCNKFENYSLAIGVAIIIIIISSSSSISSSISCVRDAGSAADKRSTRASFAISQASRMLRQRLQHSRRGESICRPQCIHAR